MQNFRKIRHDYHLSNGQPDHAGASERAASDLRKLGGRSASRAVRAGMVRCGRHRRRVFHRVRTVAARGQICADEHESEQRNQKSLDNRCTHTKNPIGGDKYSALRRVRELGIVG